MKKNILIKLNRNKLGTLTSFRDLFWWKDAIQITFTVANLPSLMDNWCQIEV